MSKLKFENMIATPPLDSTPPAAPVKKTTTSRAKKTVKLSSQIPLPPVNDRFRYLEQAIYKMVLEKKIKSIIITGAGGLGKTYTVRQALRRCGYFEMGSEGVGRGYVSNTGHISARSLFDLMSENRDKIIVFDDCDSMWSGSERGKASGVLKGALDSNDGNIVKWNVQNGPEPFEFTGGMIFITNLDSDKLDQAIRTRAYIADLSMTETEKVERIMNVLPTMINQMDMFQDNVTQDDQFKNPPVFPELPSYMDNDLNEVVTTVGWTPGQLRWLDDNNQAMRPSQVKQELQVRVKRFLDKYLSHMENFSMRHVLKILSEAADNNPDWEEMTAFFLNN